MIARFCAACEIRNPAAAVVEVGIGVVECCDVWRLTQCRHGCETRYHQQDNVEGRARPVLPEHDGRPSRRLSNTTGHSADDKISHLETFSQSPGTDRSVFLEGLTMREVWTSDPRYRDLGGISQGHDRLLKIE